MNKNTNQAKALVKTDDISSFSNLDEAAQRYSDDWENITGLKYEDEYPEAINKLDFINGAKWRQKQNLEKIAEKFAIEFAEWLREECYDTGSHWLFQKEDEIYTSLEILEVFKREVLQNNP